MSSTPEDDRLDLPRIPSPPTPANVGVGQEASLDIKLAEPEVEKGFVGAGEDPLVEALRVAALMHPDKLGGHSAMFPAAVARHFSQENVELKRENRRLHVELSELRDAIGESRADNASLRAQINALEKPWSERMRQIVGGGLMGASFKLYDFNGGVAIFFFVLGAVLSIGPLIPSMIAAIRKRN